ELVADTFPVVDRAETDESCPEHLTRFAGAPAYELAPRTQFRDLFAGRFGSRGICGGYGTFEPGASLPCHYHGYDESITIVAGEAMSRIPEAQLFLATSQSEIAAAEADAARLFATVHDQLGGRITAARWCPNPPQARCAGHKPGPALLLDLAADHKIDLAHAW